MNTFQDVVFICTLFSCFFAGMCSHASKKSDCKNTNDVATQTLNENILYSDFMFNIEPSYTNSIIAELNNDDEQIKYKLTILVPEKHDEHIMKADTRGVNTWGACECKFHQVILVDHHDTKKNTHTLCVIEGDGNHMVSLFDFIIKYSTEWPLQNHQYNGVCRFMIVNGKFLLLGICRSRIDNEEYKYLQTQSFFTFLKKYVI